MLINSSLGRNTLGFKPSQKNFEHLGIVSGLSTDFTKNQKNLWNTHSGKIRNDRNRQMIF
tara:strand:+ start:283 stop:462 length:180 start_codon:yes stop_codon:yes gene_type:complete